MYIGDLHIHSRYSRATSRDCTPECLELWARKKGIHILGTGDFTHPAWREELREKLEPAEDGLYVLKEEYRIREDGAPDTRPRFVVTGEISSIYKKKDKVRKVHSLLLLPGLEAAQDLARRLELIGNIHSDGRPILGLDCRDLLEIMLETSPEAVYVPAHIWTPHFSMFGAFSGFSTVEECFEDLTPYVHAVETGLSSDPPMNWRVSALDGYHLISNSDAHSPARLGREASLFDIELSFQGLSGAVCEGKGLAGTLEFFPEEGKYHFDGHRKCGLCITPQETARYGNRCPVCGKKITVGVLNRVEQLADRREGFVPPDAAHFESLVPLPEVIAASVGASAAGKKVQGEYERLVAALGPEFEILRRIPVEDIRKAAGPLIAEGIRRLREGRVERTPGFDGEYGKISLLSQEERSALEGQLSLFKGGEGSAAAARTGRGKRGGTEKRSCADIRGEASGEREEELPAAHLNLDQQEAVEARERAVAVIAGPGTGKTKTLVSRLLYLMEERAVAPACITAVTFTCQAAEELASRLAASAGDEETRRRYGRLHIGTFHALCSRFLHERGRSFLLADEGLQQELAEEALGQCGCGLSPDRLLRELSLTKNTIGTEGATDWLDALPEGAEAGGNGRTPSSTEQGSEAGRRAVDSALLHRAFVLYQKLMRERGALDYDDLLLETLRIMEGEEIGEEERACFSYLLIDEFQDVNPLQYRLMRAWNRTGKELFVIGDPDQAIYGFRGSDNACFERLKEDFPQLRTICLRTNYRSTPQILSAALALISRNEGGPRRMEAKRPDGAPVRAVSATDEQREALFVARQINRLIGGIDMLDTQENGDTGEKKVRGFSDIAVLYRTHRQAARLENCLRQEGIPYVVAGREDFLAERGVRAVLSFFYSLLHPGDRAADDQCRRLLLPLLEGEEALDFLTGKYKKKVKRMKTARLLEEWQKEISFPEPESMEKLIGMAVLYPSMEIFLEQLSLGEEGDVRRSGSRGFQADVVTLMTLHGSKGLEFPVVFLYGMDRGRLPLEFGSQDVRHMQEERRLCFVGMTRAEEELILTCSSSPSVFLEELPGRLILRESAAKEKEERTVQLELFDFMK